MIPKLKCSSPIREMNFAQVDESKASWLLQNIKYLHENIVTAYPEIVSGIHLDDNLISLEITSISWLFLIIHS